MQVYLKILMSDTDVLKKLVQKGVEFGTVIQVALVDNDPNASARN